MSDETTLLPCPFCGGNNVAASYHSPFIVCEDCGAFGPGSADSTHDEAIAAWNTRVAKPCYATDYTHEHCKYSTNREWTEDTKFYIPTVRHGTLTAEQVREAVEKHWHDLPDEYDMPEAIALPEYSYDWQAIADELNATIGGGCAMETLLRYDGSDPHYRCTECGHENYEDKMPAFCPRCGKAVKR